MKTIITFFILVNTCCVAQSVTSEERTKANDYFTEGNWPQVVLAYQAIAKREPQNSNARMRAGIGLLNQSKTMEAIKQLEEAVALGTNPMPLFYLATAYAQANQPEKCFESLDKSFTYGFASLTLFESDANLAKLKSSTTYEALHQRLLRGVYPCRYSQEARQFDFWIGEWDVKSTTGQAAGRSSIEIILGDCVIFENWT
jgi:tetratricopeptide (TPR) repeat protein